MYCSSCGARPRGGRDGAVSPSEVNPGMEDRAEILRRLFGRMVIVAAVIFRFVRLRLFV